MIYGDCKVYGPYKRKDGREHVLLIYIDGSRQTVSYPKFLYEKHIGRYLEEDETIDHIDGNPLNNDFSNIRILKRSDHAKLDVVRVKFKNFVCDVCGANFVLFGRRLNNAVQNRRKGRYGPYCSKSCAGKASHLKGRILKQIVVEHYQNKDFEL